MPKSKFAGPGKSFPVENKAHAKAALMDVGGDKKLSSAQKATVRSKARGVLSGMKK
jgi:hypothetical protein